MSLISEEPAGGKLRGLFAPRWLAEVVRLRREPVPWPQMSHAVLAICVPLGTGLAIHKPVLGVLPGTGGLLSTLVNRSGPYRARIVRIAAAAVCGGAAGLLIGTLIHGRGWLTVAALVAVAGVSAMVSVAGATASLIGLQLLVYTSFAIGPLGALRPWWATPLLFLTGVAWGLALLLPGWLVFGRVVEQRLVADVYRAVAAKLRSIGTAGFEDSRRRVTAALNTAYDELLAERSVTSGRDPRQAWRMALLNQALMLAEASTAMANGGRRPTPDQVSAVEGLAGAIQYGGPVPAIPDVPEAAPPAMVAMHDVLAAVAGLLEDGPGGEIRRARRRRVGGGERLARFIDRFRGGRFTSVFTIRLMLCIGVAAVISDVLPLQRSYWVILTVAIVLKPDFGSVFARALQRSIGTVVGAVLGAVLIAVTPYGPLLLIPLGVCAFLVPYGRSRNYGMFATFLTPLVVLLIDLLVQGGWRLAEARLIDTLIGCAVVLLVGYAPWPASWYAHLPGNFAAAAEGVAAYLERALAGQQADAAVAEAAGNLTRQRRRMYRRLSDLNTQFQRTLAEPAAVSRRATAWWPAAVALERVMDQVTAVSVAIEHGVAPPSREAVTTLAAALRDIAAAVRSGHEPVRHDRLTDLRDGEPLKPVAETVLAVESALSGQRLGAAPGVAQRP